SGESGLGKGRAKREGDADVEGNDIQETTLSGGRHAPFSSDPEDYLHAQKKLKKAVLEHYRYAHPQ
ncbi:hypothetical protein C0991_003594, partial [Blastosporella zonata]